MTLEDCFIAFEYARMWAGRGDLVALNDARVMYALCVNDAERETMRVAFEEGVRDYVYDVADKVAELSAIELIDY